MAIGWHSPAGFKHPGLAEYEGEGGLAWLRSFSGLLVTCGLDHILFMYDEPAEHYVYGPRQDRQPFDPRPHRHPPGAAHRLRRDAGTATTARCGAKGWCSQATVFGEDLQLVRRIEAKVGSNEIRLHDRVVNRGFYRTPHMYCYHINVGHPVLAEGSRYLAPITRRRLGGACRRRLPQAEASATARCRRRRLNFHEQVWQHELAADAAARCLSLSSMTRSASASRWSRRKDQFPCMFEWQNLQAGQYALGIEPSTNHVLGHKAARRARRTDLARAWRGAQLRHAPSASWPIATISLRPRSGSPLSPRSRPMIFRIPPATICRSRAADECQGSDREA